MSAPTATLCAHCQFGQRCAACTHKYGPVCSDTNATIGPGAPSNGVAVYKSLPLASEAKKRADECKAAREAELNTHRPRLEHLVATAVEEAYADTKYWTVLSRAYMPTDTAQLGLLKTIITERGYSYRMGIDGITILFEDPSK